jgi:hypothetical protein
MHSLDPNNPGYPYIADGQVMLTDTASYSAPIVASGSNMSPIVRQQLIKAHGRPV